MPRAPGGRAKIVTWGPRLYHWPPSHHLPTARAASGLAETSGGRFVLPRGWLSPASRTDFFRQPA